LLKGSKSLADWEIFWGTWNMPSTVQYWTLCILSICSFSSVAVSLETYTYGYQASTVESTKHPKKHGYRAGNFTFQEMCTDHFLQFSLGSHVRNDCVFWFQGFLKIYLS
jgi:hypothetical protein